MKPVRHNLLFAPLVLASSSAVRAQILKEYGFRFVVRPADVDETPQQGEGAAQLAGRLARSKCAAVHRPLEHAVTLGADTVVQNPDGEVLGKPKNPKEAERILHPRSGARVRVFTGVALRFHSSERHFVAQSAVEFLPFSAAQLQALVHSEEWRGVAGGLRIEGEVTSKLIARTVGDVPNIMGLPVGRVAEAMRGWGVE